MFTGGRGLVGAKAVLYLLILLICVSLWPLTHYALPEKSVRRAHPNLPHIHGFSRILAR